jgi:hypothetical protein
VASGEEEVIPGPRRGNVEEVSLFDTFPAAVPTLETASCERADVIVRVVE